MGYIFLGLLVALIAAPAAAKASGKDLILKAAAEDFTNQDDYSGRFSVITHLISDLGFHTLLYVIFVTLGWPLVVLTLFAAALYHKPNRP